MQKVKCAVYVRKSTERGLEQEFNSLHNQEDSCKAYIASQSFNNWEYYKTYADGGISGGSMKRPSLQKMLLELEQGYIQVVIVYKLDRLSRSILDFHKMMLVFEKQNCNFVSVTQSFDTSNSMGKLTLNMLLSFAQFEREIASERVKDKIYASKKKGFWTGGTPKLGYDVIEKKLIINPEEAKQIKFIYEQYLKYKSIKALTDFINSTHIRTKKWETSKGITKGGNTFTTSMIHRRLIDQTYIGRTELLSTKESWEGKHEAIIDKGLWGEVRALMKENRNAYVGEYSKEKHMLSDLLQTEQGGKFRKDKSKKEDRIYRYYVNGGIRLPAGKIEQITTEILENISVRAIPRKVFEKIVFSNNKLTFYINKDNEYLDTIYVEKLQEEKKHHIRSSLDESQILISVKLIHGYKNYGYNFVTEEEVNVSILKALSYGWRYRKMLQEGIPISKIEEIEKIDARKLYKHLRLTYLSPKIIDKLMSGKISMSLADLCDIASKYKDFDEQNKCFSNL